MLPNWTPMTASLPCPRDEWEKTSEFHGRVQDRMNHQEERERAFLDFGGRLFCHLPTQTNR